MKIQFIYNGNHSLLFVGDAGLVIPRSGETIRRMNDGDPVESYVVVGVVHDYDEDNVLQGVNVWVERKSKGKR